MGVIVIDLQQPWFIESLPLCEKEIDGVTQIFIMFVTIVPINLNIRTFVGLNYIHDIVNEVRWGCHKQFSNIWTGIYQALMSFRCGLDQTITILFIRNLGYFRQSVISTSRICYLTVHLGDSWTRGEDAFQLF